MARVSRSPQFIAAVLGLAAGAAAPASFALPVDGPGLVLMVDGTDSNVTVNVTALDGTLPLSRYDFGFVSGSSYTRITSVLGNYTFAGGALVDFALRDRGSDATFGTGDDMVFSISNPLDYADQIYSIEVDPSNSQHPVVSTWYYRSLIIAWDLDRNGVMDTGFDIGISTPLFTNDGVAPAPVPLPAAVWLLGSGLLSVAGFIRRRGRSA